MGAVSIGPVTGGPFDTAGWTAIGFTAADEPSETASAAEIDPGLAALGRRIEASLTFELAQPVSEETIALFMGPRPPAPATHAVLIESTDLRPVYEPRPPAPFRPRRGFWAWLSGANAAAERSWRGRYAAYRLRHRAWVARGCPDEEEVLVRYYIPAARLTTTGE